MKDPAGFKLMTYRSVNVLTDCTMLLGTDFEKEIPVVYQNMLHFIDYFDRKYRYVTIWRYLIPI